MRSHSELIRRPTQLSEPEREVLIIPTQLPLLPDHMRALSNPIARSGLFTIGNRAQKRENLKSYKVAALEGIVIEYTGEELFQDDHDVFMQVCHIARNSQLGTTVSFTAYSMIKRLGWTQTTASYVRLSNCLTRLKATALAITFELPGGKRASYTGSLVRSFRWKEDTTGERLREWDLLLEREIIALFPEEGYSRIEWAVHRKLSPMAKWLHNFYATHQYAYAYSVRRIHQLMRSKAKNLNQFRENIKQALTELLRVGFLRQFEVTAGDMVEVIRVGYEEPDRLHVKLRIAGAEVVPS